MPQHHNQLVNSYFNSSICDDGNGVNIAAAFTLSSLDNSNYMDEPLLGGTSGDPVMPDQAELSYTEMEEWQTKSVKHWTEQDIAYWLNNVARYLNVCCTELPTEKFVKFNGAQMLALTKSDFIKIDRKFGEILYQKFQDKAKAETISHYHQLSNASCIRYESEESMDTKDPNILMTPFNTVRIDSSFRSVPTGENNNEETELPSAPVTSSQSPPQKKRPGRPKGSKRKKKPEKLGRLWEFLRDLLKNREYCPSLIVWDNHDEGMFRFVHSDKVAKLWGNKKDNPEMNYEKLSRAMRYYYKSEVLLPVIGRRLVYKFGPKAKDWRVENPNFRD